jgi:hypothetical protein
MGVGFIGSLVSGRRCGGQVEVGWRCSGLALFDTAIMGLGRGSTVGCAPA